MLFALPLLCFLLMPALAHAWGGITHLEYSHAALASLSVFAPAVKNLLQKYTDHFLYGSVAADITLGKNLRGYMYNCHNWDVAFDLFENKAKKDSQKAFMLGYLSHLAADTVAHNYFVPYKMVLSWQKKFFHHVYWEVRMDLSVEEKHWKLLEAFLAQDFSENDALLEGHLKQTFFSFKTNKKIFNGLIILQQFKKYKELVSLADKKSSWVLTPQDIKRYKALAMKAVIDFLTHLDQSFCLQADPTGKIKMVYARELIEGFRETSKTTKLDPNQEAAALKTIRGHFENSIYEDTYLPTLNQILQTQDVHA